MSSFLAFSDKNTLSSRKKFLTSVNPLVNHANLPVFCGFSGFRKSGHSESKKYEFYDPGNLSVSFWYSQHYQCHISNVSARAQDQRLKS